jgi:hypothetical protein
VYIRQVAAAVLRVDVQLRAVKQLTVLSAVVFSTADGLHPVVCCLCATWLLQPAFPAELEGQLGPQLIEAWGFLTGQAYIRESF